MITVHHLTKVFRTSQKDPGLTGAVKSLFRPRYQLRTAVDNISFTVAPGEIVGYIGVNGAGKSTTIKMLTGILAPSSGTVRVLGRDPHRERVASVRQIGVVFGQRSQLWWDLALIESFNLIAKIYEVEPARYKLLLSQLSETLELHELFYKPIRTMSLGQKMRAELAAALIHEPKIVYLDEPTIGLDLLVKERIREVIKRQNTEHGTTFILTTHDLGDIEELCRRVIMIDAGKLIYDGLLSNIKDRFGKYRTLTFDTAEPIGALALPPGAEVIAQAERKLVLRFDRNLLTASQATAAVMSQVEVVDFVLTEADLGEVIKQIYNGALRRPEEQLV